MKCPHCSGGVVELFITSKQCDRCDGRGNLEIEEASSDEIVANMVRLAEGLSDGSERCNVWLRPAPDVLKAKLPADRLDGFTYEPPSNLAGVTAAASPWMPAPAFRLDMSAAREQMHRDLVRDEAHLHKAIADYVCDYLGRELVGYSWERGAHGMEDGLVVRYRRRRGRMTYPARRIVEDFRAVYVQDSGPVRPRLSSIEVRDGVKWKTLRAFDADGNVAQQSPEAE